MTINLPRYSKDSPVDLVDGAYGINRIHWFNREW